MKMKFKTPAALVMSMMLALGLAAAPVSAASAPTIEKISYEGKGTVEVDFYGSISYENPTLEVTDTSGSTYNASFLERDDDDLTFKIKSYKTGKTYNFKINGIKEIGSSEYTSISGQVKIPGSNKVVIKDVDYDAEDREVDIEFKGSVKFKSPKVKITRNGKNYAGRIISRDNDSIEVKVKGLRYNKKYTCTVKGVRNADGTKYKTVTKTFRAYDD